MSINAKMTAIADKIRSLLGITGTMGLDAMANNLGTVQTNVANAFTTIDNKGGTVPSSKTSGNLVSAIQSIPTTPIIQTDTGTFTTEDYCAYITCGFIPDIVTITRGESSEDEDDGYIYISEVTLRMLGDEYAETNAALWSYSDPYEVFSVYAWAEESGFGVYIKPYDESWGAYDTPVTFNYIAVKYT